MHAGLESGQIAEVNHGVTPRKRGNCSKTASSWLTVIREAMTVRTIQTCKRFTALDLFRKAVGASKGPPINTAKTWALHTALEPRLSAPTRADGSVSSSRATQRSLQDALLGHVQSENRLSNSGDTELEVAEFQTQDVQQDKTA